jgi:hypothetical protein
VVRCVIRTADGFLRWISFLDASQDFQQLSPRFLVYYQRNQLNAPPSSWRRAAPGDDILMKRNSLMSKFLILATLLALCAPLTFADTPGRHPGYLHALSDLRFARALLRVDYGDDWPAIHQVDEAIAEAKNAAIDDGKPLSDHPRVDAGLDRPGRLRKAIETLDAAERDMMQEEDNPAASEWRNRAVNHIREARKLIRMEMR